MASRLDRERKDLSPTLVKEPNTFNGIIIRNMKSDELVRPVLDCKLGAVNCVRFTSDGNYCVTAGDDKTVRLYNPHKSSLSKDR